MTHNFFFIFPFSTWSLERIHTRDVYYFLIIWFRGSSIFWAWCLEIAGGELYGISPAISLFFHEIVEIAHLPYDTYSSREYPYIDLLPRTLNFISLKSYPECSAKSGSEVASDFAVNMYRECRKYSGRLYSCMRPNHVNLQSFAGRAGRQWKCDTIILPHPQSRENIHGGARKAPWNKSRPMSPIMTYSRYHFPLPGRS